MSAEAASTQHEGVSPERMSVDELIAWRVQLGQELGTKSTRLCDANSAYKDCITDIIAVNNALRNKGVDTNALGQNLGRVPYIGH